MRGAILIAAGLVSGFVSTAGSVELQKCNDNSLEKRVTCLQSNIVLLNSAYEKTTAEMRGAIADLKSEVEKRITKEEFKTELDKQISAVRSSMPRVDDVVLSWKGNPSGGSCLTYYGGGNLTIADVCNDPNRNKFQLRPF